MEIQPYQKNAKKHPKKQVEQVAASIKEFGMNQPIVVDKQGVIIVGHGRYEALKSLGMEVKDEYIKVVDLTEEQAKAYRLADNKLNESEWDMNLVIEELKGLSESMLELTGFDKDLIIEPDEQDDEVPDVPEEPQSKLGDLYELGNHRVLCGDSTKLEDVERLMDGKKADLVLTDPPYGIKRDKGFGGFGGFGEPIARRQYADDWDSDRPSQTTFNSLLAMGESVIIFGGNFFADILPKGNHWIVWDKLNTMPTFGDCELAWTNIKRDSVKKITFQYNGLIGKEKERFHPTQKPVGLMIDISSTYSEEGQIIADPFLGSGSTLIASEKTGRVCYGMELSEAYIDVIVSRYCEYTNNYDIIKNGEKIRW